MRKKVFVLIFSILICAPNFAWASSPWAEAGSYKDQVLQKYEFGIKNMLAGWTELFNAPCTSRKEGQNIFGGIGRGIWNSVADTVGGILHVVTVPIPAIDIPLPENGVDFA